MMAEITAMSTHDVYPSAMILPVQGIPVNVKNKLRKKVQQFKFNELQQSTLTLHFPLPNQRLWQPGDWARLTKPK